jgi:hypothetical protein
MAKKKINIIDLTGKKNSILLDEFLYDLVRFSIRRRISNKNYMENSDLKIVSDLLTREVRRFRYFRKPKLKDIPLSELCRQICIEEVCSRYLIDEFRKNNAMATSHGYKSVEFDFYA